MLCGNHPKALEPVYSLPAAPSLFIIVPRLLPALSQAACCCAFNGRSDLRADSEKGPK